MGALSKKILQAALALASIIVFGTVGYMVVEGWSLVDALYMVIITITTTGYQEVHPLSNNGRILTMVILAGGVGLFSFSIGRIAREFLLIDLGERRRRSMLKKIATWKGHTIVCGFGRMGEVICDKLHEEELPFVVIEKRPDLIRILKSKGFFYIEGDAAHDEYLVQGGVEQAKNLVTVIDDDAAALYITVAGRAFNPSLYIISRANELASQKRLKRAGANKVILPFVMSGMKVAESVINPAVDDFLDLTGHGLSNNWVQIADLYVDDQSKIVGKKVADFSADLGTLILIGVRKSDGEFIFKPGGQYRFDEGDCLITMGDQRVYREVKKKLSLSTHTPNTMAS